MLRNTDAQFHSGHRAIRLLLGLPVLFMAAGYGVAQDAKGDKPQFAEHLIKDRYSYSYGLDRADFDGDGDLDIASCDTRNFKLYWYENDGHGKFSPHLIEDGDRLQTFGDITGEAVAKSVRGDAVNDRWFKTPRLERLMAGDVDGDGKPDVVIVENLFGDVYWYRNSGTPAKDVLWQQFRITTRTIPGAYDVALADFDGDGDQDVAASTWRLSNKFVWFENPGHFDKPGDWKQRLIEENIAEPRTVRIGDFNLDGKPDVLGAAFTANQVMWYANPGDLTKPTWPKVVIDGQSTQPSQGMPADIDGDGDLDVVMALGLGLTNKEQNSREVVWYENLGERARGNTWEKHVVGADIDEPFEAIAVDLNGDGKLDIAATSYAAPQGGVVWFEQPADSRAKWPKSTIKANWARANAIIAGDFDGDGRPDLVAGTTGNTAEVRWWKNLFGRVPKKP